MNTITKLGLVGVATVATVGVINMNNEADAASNYGTYKTTNILNLRKGMGTNYASLTKIPKGGSVTVLMQYSNGWSKVTYNGKTGYVSSQYISKSGNTNNNNSGTVNTTGKGTYYTTENLNLRKGMGTNYASILKIPKGGKVTLLASASNGWSKVTYNGYTGYVSSQYISKTTTGNTNNNVSTRSTKGTLRSTLLIVNKSTKRISYYVNGKLDSQYACAIGAPSSPTPNGKRYVQEKIINRPYYKDHIAGGDPRNPLGDRWMGLGGEYGIHGTNNERSIGGAVSHGCIRMYNKDVRALYNKVPKWTMVLIDNGTNQDIASRYSVKIYY